MRWPRVQRVKRFKLLYEKNHDTYNIEPESQGSKGIRLVESFVDYSAGRDARSRKGEGMGVARLLLSTCARSQWEATMARGSWDESNKSGEVISRPETHRGKRSDATFRWFISVIQLSSSSASIPPFNSRPAINNLPAIVPSLFLFIPPLSRDARFSKFSKAGNTDYRSSVAHYYRASLENGHLENRNETRLCALETSCWKRLRERGQRDRNTRASI